MAMINRELSSSFPFQLNDELFLSLRQSGGLVHMGLAGYTFSCICRSQYRKEWSGACGEIIVGIFLPIIAIGGELIRVTLNRVYSIFQHWKNVFDIVFETQNLTISRETRRIKTCVSVGSLQGFFHIISNSL